MSSCTTCGSPLDAAQRFCLECGSRVGAPLREALGLDVPAAAAPLVLVPAPGARLEGGWLPSPRVAAVAVMALLAFGVVIGSAAGPRTDASLAAARSTIVVEESPAPVAAAQAATPAAASSSDDAGTDDSGSGDDGTSADASSDASLAPAGIDESAPVAATPTETTPDTTDTTTTTPAAPALAPPIKHVWVIDLADQPYARTFGDPAAMPYLASLKAKGGLLSGFASTARTTADAGALLLGGQGCPTPGGTRQAPAPLDPAPAPLVPVPALPVDPGAPPAADPAATPAPTATTAPSTTPPAPGAAAPFACAFTAKQRSLPDQLAGNGLTWRGYLESVTPTTPVDCKASGKDSRNPFLFFASITATPDCASNLAGTDRIVPDAADAESAPAFSLIVPGPCHDGVDAPCTPGALAGPAAADAWLRTIVDPLLASKAYANAGLIVITTDHDATTPGGKTGALLLSRFVKGGNELGRPFDTLSLLRASEDIFALPYLGAAGKDSVPAFDTGVWTNWSQAVDESDTGS